LADADGSARVVLHEGEDGVAAGQACVFYASGDNEARLLGGGFIARTSAGQGAGAGQAAPTLELSRTPSRG
jgi:tRNA-specific 2-thiouridylase